MVEATTQNSTLPAVRLENVGKRFEIMTERPNSILEAFISRVPFTNAGKTNSRQDLWAVKGIDFDLMSGQCLGIVGQNGSGKSTLMKLIARILRPSTGRITVRGRVSALLELGAGFHPDLTGRENIFLNASVLGLKKKDIETHFDSVVAFSGLDKFIDTPVKHYSSGMHMRLGFSVAVHVNPDILIIDEILAVGDQAFQEKCINHIYEMKQRGTTIVLVSHNLDFIRKLCTHMVWMEKGEIRGYGTTEKLIQDYLSFLQERGYRPTVENQEGFKRLGTQEVEITAVCLYDEAGKENQDFLTGKSMTVEIHFTAHKPVDNPEFGLAIYRRDGVQISGPNSQLAGMRTGTVSGSGVVRYHVPALPLLPARYVLTAAIQDSRYSRTYDHHHMAYPFQVGSGGTREIFGCVAMPATWEWEQKPA